MIACCLGLAAALAAPAFGGPNIVQVAKRAARALKLSKQADKRSRKALALAQRAIRGTGQSGTNGLSGTNGQSGTQGLPGPPGPSAATPVDFRANAGTGPTTILNQGGLVMTATCAAGPNLSVRATTTVGNSEIHVAAVTKPAGSATSTADYTDNDHFSPGTSIALPTGNAEGTLTYSTPGGSVVTVTFAAEQGAFGGATACWFGGWSLHNPS